MGDGHLPVRFIPKVPRQRARSAHVSVAAVALAVWSWHEATSRQMITHGIGTYGVSVEQLSMASMCCPWPLAYNKQIVDFFAI